MTADIGTLGRALAGLVLATALVTLAGGARAERAWVKDELRLNIRTGPGVQYRIVQGLGTGDVVEIIERGEGWTKVRVNGIEGWIPGGYLQSDPPARVTLERHREESQGLQQRVDELAREASSLREDNQGLAQRDEGQRAEIAQLTQENMRLRAGARWPEWIAGAGLLCAGMTLGALLHRNATRRPSPRIRL